MRKNSQNQLSIRMILRQATHHHHVALNRNPMLSPIMEKRISLLEYKHLLQAYLPLYERLESIISRALADYLPEFDYSQRFKTAWLHQDLLVMTCELRNSVEIESYRPCEPSNASELIGLLYVLEGSTLGGQVISRLISQRFSIGAETGLRFFCGYGLQTQALWEEFISLASNRIGEDREAINCASQYACQIFSEIGAYLSSYHRRVNSNEQYSS